MSLLSLSSIEKYFGAEKILDGVSFRVERGDKAALIGTNGAGKSTILRIIAGVEEPDGGTLALARNTRIAYLPQDPDFNDEHTLYEAVLEAFRDVMDAQERLRILEREMASNGHDQAVVEEYGRLQHVVEHGGYDYRQQTERALTGLGLTEDLWYQPVAQLSGGQRTRANLARTLLEDADLLLLDEPTNHLDIAAVEWLEAYLRDVKRSFLIVAHDRYLLDRVTRRTLALSFGKVTEYDAPYGRYLELRAERMERMRQEYEAQQEHIARTEEFIRRYGAGQRSKEARGRQKRLNRLERVERPPEEEAVHLSLKKASRTGEIVLTAERLVAGYPANPLVALPDQVVVRRGEKIAIIGPNGAGKSTLLKTLIGQVGPLEGKVRWGSNVSIGYYSQTLERLDERKTALDEIQSVRVMSEEEARSFLGQFLFSGDDVFKSVGVLSGGERSRIALAKLILEEPNVLVLDEPTNHLDISSRDALEKVLQGFNGTLLFVSHDRYLIDRLTQQVWLIGDGRLTRYDGNYSAYASGKAGRIDREEPRPATRGARGSAAGAQRLTQLDAEVESLASRLSDISGTASLGQLTEVVDRYAEVQAQLEETQIAWLRALRDELRSSSD